MTEGATSVAAPQSAGSAFKTWAAMVLFVLFSLAAGAIGSYFSAPAIPDWYRQLQRPSWTPPDWLFGPVWTVLYILIGLAAWLVWKKAGWRAALPALLLFGVQWMLNAAWSILFFGMGAIGAALLELLALISVIVATTIAFGRIRPAAAMLMLPYLLWCLFAAGLNYAIWRMNP